MTGEDSTPRVVAAQEEAVFGKRSEAAARVRVTKVTRIEDQTVEGELDSEDVDIRRVRVERWVDGPVPVRQEGDVTVISLVEEVAVIERRLRVFEEIHLSKKTTRRAVRETVPVRRQDISVERTVLGEQGDRNGH